MVEPLRHRQTKGAATDMFYLTPPRHISTLPKTEVAALGRYVRSPENGHRQANLARPQSAVSTHFALYEAAKRSQHPGSPLRSHGSRRLKFTPAPATRSVTT